MTDARYARYESLLGLLIMLEGRSDEGAAECLSTLSDRLRAALERRARPRFEIDLEALLEADGVVHRPGPREHLDTQIVGLLREAVPGGCRVGPIAFLLGEGRQ